VESAKSILRKIAEACKALIKLRVPQKLPAAITTSICLKVMDEHASQAA
jgi:hypothetical protein